MASKDVPKAEITKRYTLESWRTQDIEIHDIPETVFSLTFEELLRKVLMDVSGMGQNPIELLFYSIFDHNGWKVVRTSMDKNRPIPKFMAAGIEMKTEIRDELYGLGVPDFFFLGSEGQYRFVEVKASEDELNSNQLEWAEEYDCNFYIAQLAPVGSGITDEEIIERNRIR